jgi:hypothetical protein
MLRLRLNRILKDVGDMSIYFNTAIQYEGRGVCETFAYKCLSPVRYLFHGEKLVGYTYAAPVAPSNGAHTRALSIELAGLQNNSATVFTFSPEPAFGVQDRKWWKAVLAIVFLAVGVLLGSLAKALSLCSSSARAIHAQAVKELKESQRFPSSAFSD